MNARNLHYILAKNTKESISLADSKLKTKFFLSSRGIPFAETYAILKNAQEVKEFNLSSIPASGFVLKPNRGSQGKGILIVKNKEGEYHIQDEVWTEEELQLHMTDIVHGSFSMHGSSDSVIVEELLTPGKDFLQYSKYGLADIRIIVYNYVPITAMVRMPTAHSEGKANLAQGGIGLGLNIANGSVLSLFQNKKIYTGLFPDDFIGLKNGKIPYWEDILLYSSQVQMYTKLGYLALDWVITENGPKLLEINARAGLEIQNVNLVPLASRLKKIKDLKIMSPEKGVEIAKTLFQTEVASPLGTKKIIGMDQTASVNGIKIQLTVDLNITRSIVSADILEDKHISSQLSIHVDGGTHLFLEKYEIDQSLNKTIKLGRNALKNYLLDPNLKSLVTPRETNNLKWSKEINQIDSSIYELGKTVNLSTILRPVNYFEALDGFVKSPHNYNPIFEYNFPTDENIKEIKKNIEMARKNTSKISSAKEPIVELYVEKIDEIESKLHLIEAYKQEDFSSISKWNNFLFGEIQTDLLLESKGKVTEQIKSSIDLDTVLGEILSFEEIVSEVHKYLEANNIKKVPVVLENENLSRVSVSYGRIIKIRLSKNAVIRKHEIPAILAHEIGTHLKRYIAGKQTGLKLFQTGTGNYLGDEEGLAIYQSFKFLPEGYEKNAIYLKYYLLSVCDTLSFSDTVETLIHIYPNKSLESIFSSAMRLKRGITHSSTKGIQGTTYKKDKVYLDGFTRLSSWINNGGNIEEMFYGKIKISDLEIIRLF